MKFLMIGAHPDDMDLRCGGLTLQLVPKGHEVRFLSMTTGNAGHQSMNRELLREARLHEMERAGTIFGVRYDTLGAEDGYLTADIPTRDRLIRYMRGYAPDVVITHRTCDYHPDHRAAGQLVNDCSYLIGVPLICPDLPIPSKPPVILSCEDGFTVPVPFRVDIAVPCDNVIEQKITGCLQHYSQFYEWLPYDGKWTDVLEADNEAEKTKLLRKRLAIRFAKTPARYPDLFDRNVHYGEVFQIDEYGGKMTDEIMEAMTGRETVVFE